MIEQDLPSIALDSIHQNLPCFKGFEAQVGRRSSGFYVQLCCMYSKCSVSPGKKVSDQQRLGWSGKILYEVSGAVNRAGRIHRIWVKEELWLGERKEDFQRKGQCKQRASIWEVMRQFWASLIAQLVKNPPAMLETPVRFLGREDTLEKG